MVVDAVLWRFAIQPLQIAVGWLRKRYLVQPGGINRLGVAASKSRWCLVFFLSLAFFFPRTSFGAKKSLPLFLLNGMSFVPFLGPK